MTNESALKFVDELKASGINNAFVEHEFDPSNSKGFRISVGFIIASKTFHVTGLRNKSEILSHIKRIYTALEELECITRGLVAA